jgi:hypothetical protein
MPEKEPDRSAEQLFDLIVSQRITAAIYVAARLGIADLIADGTKTVGAIARSAGADEAAVRRLLRALVTLGLLREGSDGDFELTTVGAHLTETDELSLKAYALLEGDIVTRAWGNLVDTIRTGKTGAEIAGSSFWANDPVAVETFNRAMANMTASMLPPLIAAYDFAGIGTLMDVGGGFGELLAAILRAHPAMHGIVFDLPRCAAGAERHFAEAGVAGRAKFMAGDFFDAIPAVADAISMKSIIHDWRDEQSRAILANCRRALPASGRLLLIERLMPENVRPDAEHLSHALSDLRMLQGPGGLERSEREYRALLAAAGFGKVTMTAAGRFNVIEARLA